MSRTFAQKNCFHVGPADDNVAALSFHRWKKKKILSETLTIGDCRRYDEP